MPAGQPGAEPRLGTRIMQDVPLTELPERIAAYLRETGWTDCALVFGAMRDKAVAEMLEALAPACAALICTTAASPRAMPAESIAALANGAGAAWPISTVPDPVDAIERAVRQFPRVVVAGSIFLTGPVRGILRAR